MPIDCLISISRFLTPCSAFAFQLSRTPTSPAPFAYEWPFTPVSGASWPLARPPPPKGRGRHLLDLPIEERQSQSRRPSAANGTPKPAILRRPTPTHFQIAWFRRLNGAPALQNPELHASTCNAQTQEDCERHQCIGNCSSTCACG
jgi:hypothetical protein